MGKMQIKMRHIFGLCSYLRIKTSICYDNNTEKEYSQVILVEM